MLVSGQKRKVRGEIENKNRTRHRGELDITLNPSWLWCLRTSPACLGSMICGQLPLTDDESGAKLGSMYTKCMNFSLLI